MGKPTLRILPRSSVSWRRPTRVTPRFLQAKSTDRARFAKRFAMKNRMFMAGAGLYAAGTILPTCVKMLAAVGGARLQEDRCQPDPSTLRDGDGGRVNYGCLFTSVLRGSSEARKIRRVLPERAARTRSAFSRKRRRIRFSRRKKSAAVGAIFCSAGARDARCGVHVDSARRRTARHASPPRSHAR